MIIETQSVAEHEQLQVRKEKRDHIRSIEDWVEWLEGKITKLEKENKELKKQVRGE